MLEATIHEGEREILCGQPELQQLALVLIIIRVEIVRLRVVDVDQIHVEEHPRREGFRK